MTIEKVLNPQHPLALSIWESYSRCFPEEERRDRQQFEELFLHPHVSVYSISQANKPIGYIVIWQLQEAIFLEHFEVFEDYRGLNLGSLILKEIQQRFATIILETEPSTLSELANRRVNFYIRNGFIIVDEAYMQPSYGNGKPSIPLYLMANKPIDHLENLIHEIYTLVYNQST